MRTIFLTQWFDPEPGVIRGLPLARWLRQRGYEIKVLTGFPNYPGGKVYPGYRIRLRQREQMDGIPILRVALYPSHDSSMVRRAANYASFALSAATLGTLLIGGADVGFVYHPPGTVGFPAIVLKALRRIPFVYHIADMWPESVVESGMVGKGSAKKLVGTALSMWCNFVYRQAAAITVLSPGFKNMLVQAGVPSEKIHIIYNWADEGAYRPLPRDAALAEQLGFQGRFNVVYAGNMGPFQALENVIRAALLLKNEPAIQIVMVGTGQKAAELKSLAQEAGAANVRFLEQRPYREMPMINSLADILLVHLKDLPLMGVTIPGKTQISLASGRPILMGVRGDAAELIRDAGAGLICEPENPSSMAQAIMEMYRMPKPQLEEMGAKGRAYYMNHLSLDIAGAKMDSIFKEIKKGKQGSVPELSTNGHSRTA